MFLIKRKTARLYVQSGQSTGPHRYTADAGKAVKFGRRDFAERVALADEEVVPAGDPPGSPSAVTTLPRITAGLALPWKVEYKPRFDTWHPKSSPRVVDVQGRVVYWPDQNVGHPGEYDQRADELAHFVCDSANLVLNLTGAARRARVGPYEEVYNRAKAAMAKQGVVFDYLEEVDPRLAEAQRARTEAYAKPLDEPLVVDADFDGAERARTAAFGKSLITPGGLAAGGPKKED